MSQVLKFVCSICPRSFAMKRSLETHLKKHCGECKQLFSSISKLRQHDQTHAGTSSSDLSKGELAAISKEFICTVCSKSFSKKKSLDTHLKKHFGEYKRFCDKCNLHIDGSEYGYHLRTNKHRNNCEAIVVDENLTKTIQDFDEKVEKYTFHNSREELLFPEEFFKHAECTVLKLLCNSLFKHVTFKFNFELVCDYVKMSAEDMIVGTMAHISKMKIVTMSEDLQDVYRNTCQEIYTKMSEFQERDSGWTLVTIRDLYININQFCITKGSQYIPTPLK